MKKKDIKPKHQPMKNTTMNNKPLNREPSAIFVKGSLTSSLNYTKFSFCIVGTVYLTHKVYHLPREIAMIVRRSSKIFCEVPKRVCAMIISKWSNGSASRYITLFDNCITSFSYRMDCRSIYSKSICRRKSYW